MADQDLTSSGTPEFAGVTVGSDPVVSRDSTDTLTNKTIDGASNTITNVAHGDQAGGSLHSVATSSVNGFISSTDKAKIDEGLTFTELSSENAGIVTLPTSGTIEVTSVSFGSLTAGDRIAVYGGIDALKGSSPGPVQIQFTQKSGTATIEFLNDKAGIAQEGASIAAATDTNLSLAGVVKVTGSGTLDLELLGRSLGSTSSVSAGGGQMYAYFLRKQ